MSRSNKNYKDKIVGVISARSKYLKKFLRSAYKAYNDFICNNKFVKNLIHWQHQAVPLPFSIFNFLFRFRITKLLFNFYGCLCFSYSYYRRENNISYWLSKESLYWHFWRQTDADIRVLNELLSIPQIKHFMQDNSLIAAELGFGLGKNYTYRLSHINKFKKYIAIEPNQFVCDYIRAKFRDPNFCVINKTLEDFINEDQPFGVLLAFGGVFMYLNEEVVNTFLNILLQRGVKKVLILNEGTTKDDIHRPDGTTMYNFRKRLEKAGYEGRFIEKEGQNNILEYFVMY